MGGAAVAAPIVASPPMSNAWSRSGAWAASAIQIRFKRRLHKSHRGTCTSDTTRTQRGQARLLVSEPALDARRCEDAESVVADLVTVNRLRAGYLNPYNS